MIRARVYTVRISTKLHGTHIPVVVTYGLEERRIVLHGLDLKNLPVMLACIQIPVFALRQDDLLLIVPEFQGRCVGGALQILCADLPAEDASLTPILCLDTEGDLIKDELCLFLPVHGAESLNLQLAENITGRLDIAIVVLLEVRENLGDTGTLNLDENLALGDRSQGLDNLDLPVNVRYIA